jgi:hypothetical protein
LFALALIATVLGLIRTLPIGSTELSRDVTRWLFHIPRWLSSSLEFSRDTGMGLPVFA